MKKAITLLVFLMGSGLLKAQVRLPDYPDSLFSTYYHQRWTLFTSLPATRDDIVFIGNSITDGGEWSELFGDLRVKNRGISGDISAGVIRRVKEVAVRKPSRVFLMIGVNDLAGNIAPDSVLKNILLITSYLKQETPATRLFVQSILPVNDFYKKFPRHTDKTEQIKQVNLGLKQNAPSGDYTYIDLYPSFCDKEGKLKRELSNDGLHLTGQGYLLWKHLVFPYVYDLQGKASLIPQPQNLSWKEGYFKLYNCRYLQISHDSLAREAGQLQDFLLENGMPVKVTREPETEKGCIELRIEKISAPVFPEEAYSIKVTGKQLVVAANTLHGIFNGIQTLKQLMRDAVMVDACEITDWPVFGWRGYMVDAGRNYMSLPLLKQLIDMMGRYRLNVFHFHPTEDIAWRLAINQYPQLTAPENMLRNKGQYYSVAEIKELINYCQERHILFVPEIDMPGHSAAFTRAMKTGMQDDAGLQLVKNILSEICTTYDLPYIHIGGDEVKITNPDFLPEITAFLKKRNKEVIGWQPGGNFTEETIRQLWMHDTKWDPGKGEGRFIDSRHLYINHMDPLESVVTLFNRKIGDGIGGRYSALGATLCLWPDRAVASEQDILNMNPVYPAMLTFAERSWRGGGTSGWITSINDGDPEAFTAFENRLLDNRWLNFKEKPFPYVRQSGLEWKLYGPFDNGGNVTKVFPPETTSWKEENQKEYKKITGGTVILRHWWSPVVKGAIDQPEENSTWYAVAKIWSDENKEQDFWIGFNNLSRSPATDSPPADKWDNRGSAVWVNNQLIPPPVWKRGGQKGNSEIPLTDEGYEYRAPVKIFLKKGWNHVLIKAPVDSFAGKDWQNPIKWMFTFIRCDNQ